MPKKKKAQQKSLSFVDVYAGPAALGGAVILLVGLAIAVIKSNFFNAVAFVVMALGLALLVAAFVARPQPVKSFLASRQMKMGSNTLVVCLTATALVVFLNIIAKRHHFQRDFTKLRLHTLSPQTKKVLKGLKKDVKMVAFYTERNNGPIVLQQVKSLLQDYENASRRVSTEVADPEVKSDMAKMHGVTTDGTTIVKVGDRNEKVNASGMTGLPAEQDVTSALLRLTRTEKKKVYFLEGHGEHDPMAYGDTSYSKAKSTLEKLNYTVDKLSLLKKQATVPSDCSLLVIAGPRAEPLAQETQEISRYTNGGGSALIMLEPALPNQKSAFLSSLLSNWNVAPQPGVVIEPLLDLRVFTNYFTPVVSRFGSHDITNNLPACFFPTAMALKVQDMPSPGSGTRVTKLAETSSESWAESTLSGKISKSPGDPAGPLTIACAISTGNPPEPPPGSPPNMPPPPATGPKSHIVVVGDSDFAEDKAYDQLGNGNFFDNCVNWLAGQEELVSIKPKEPEKCTLTITGSQVRKLFFLSILLIPFAVLLTGTIVWWKRR